MVWPAKLPALLGLLVLGALPVLPAFAHESTPDEIATLSSRIASGNASAADYLRRGELHRLCGEWPAARADYDRASRLEPRSIDVALCRAALSLATGKAADAKSALDRVIARSPDRADALELRSRVFLSLGRPLDAAHDLERVIARLDRPTPDHYASRARALVAAGERHIGEALAGLDQGIERLGPIVSLESHAIDLELGRGAYDAALARLDRLAPQLSVGGLWLERRGGILAQAGRADEARAAFAAALDQIDQLPPSRRASQAVLDREARLRAALASASPGSTATDANRPGETTP